MKEIILLHEVYSSCMVPPHVHVDSGPIRGVGIGHESM